jgi:hypothetical protein
MTDLITLPRATVQQALEAWEQINLYGFVLADYEGPMEQAITSLRAALEQLEPPPEAQTEAERVAYCAGWWAAMQKMREQQEQEYAGIPGTNVRVRIPTKYRDPSCVGAFNRAKPEHITDGSPCWCDPELNYVDPETGVKVWVHKEPQ